MCYSATASFTAAGILAVAGAATLAQRPERARVPFALIPLFFAVHQAIEGFVWLSVDPGPPPAALVFAWLFIAQMFWPVYTPAAVLAFEDDPRRRIALLILLAVGISVSAALGYIYLNHDYSVHVVKHSLSYVTELRLEKQLLGPYLVAVAAPLLISRHRYIMAFGGVVLFGAVVTQLAFYHAAASVWCFIAAIASLFVFLHVRRRRLRRS